MWIPVLLLIAFYDYQRHRIPNLFLAALILSSFFDGAIPLEPLFILLSSSAVLTLTFVTRCGFGDAKLAIILLNLFVGRSQILDFLLALALISMALLLLHLLRHRSFRGEIAFAPALCGAVLAITA